MAQRKGSSRAGSGSSRSSSSRSRSTRASSSGRRSGSSRSRSASSRSNSSRSATSRTRSTGRTGESRSRGTTSARGRPSRRTSTSARSRSSRAALASTRSGNRERTRSSAQSHALTDHDAIRQWAEERNASPACVRGTGGGEDVGMIRLDFPGFSGQGSLEHIEWDEWFQKFDESGLALLVQETTAGGERSNFNKLVKRETAGTTGKRPSRGARGSSRRAA